MSLLILVPTGRWGISLKKSRGLACTELRYIYYINVIVAIVLKLARTSYPGQHVCSLPDIIT